MTMESDVLVMGGGATGHLAAAYLRMRFPKLKVSVVEGPHKNRLIVGESFVGASRYFSLGLGPGHRHEKKMALQETWKEKKNVYWFRLKNSNPEILSHIQAIKKPNRSYVPYYATHHFFGKGNWIWCIPMRSPENEPLISIGITYRKDVYPHGEVRTLDQFLDCVGREHPVLVELVRSGTIVDTNFYSSYMWECRQRYSPDRWYIIGDAGDTVDPLYSVGLALSSLQIRQIAAIIQRELNGFDTKEFTKDLDTVLAAFQRSVTRDTTRLYECMGDAYQCHLRVHLAVTTLFH